MYSCTCFLPFQMELSKDRTRPINLCAPRPCRQKMLSSAFRITEWPNNVNLLKQDWNKVVYKRRYILIGPFCYMQCKKHLKLNTLDIKSKNKKARTNFPIDFETFKVAGLMSRPWAGILPPQELPLSSPSSSLAHSFWTTLCQIPSLPARGNTNRHCWIWTPCCFHLLPGRGWDPLSHLSFAPCQQACVAQVAAEKAPVEWRPFGVS